MSKYTVQISGCRDEVMTIIISDDKEEFLKTTIEALKRKIHDRVPEVEPEYMRLLFAGKQLADEDPSTKRIQTLRDYNIQNKSVLQVVIRVHGGSHKIHPRVQPPPQPTEEKEHPKDDFSLKFTTKDPDSIQGFSFPDDQPRIVMSCGHAVDCNSLTAYCRSLIDQQEFVFTCPAIIDDEKNTKCKKEWEYSEVRRVAVLTENECKFFESRMSEYAMQQYFDVRECPGCQSFVERIDNKNLRVKCQICSNVKGREYEFCWNCMKEWSGPSKSSLKCGNPNCVHPDLPSVRDAPMNELNGRQVPSRRACPTCGRVVERKDGCKFVICPRCKKEYCFMCLELKDVCLKSAPSSWYKECKKDVAPKQTEIPVWSAKK